MELHHGNRGEIKYISKRIKRFGFWYLIKKRNDQITSYFSFVLLFFDGQQKTNGDLPTDPSWTGGYRGQGGCGLEYDQSCEGIAFWPWELKTTGSEEENLSSALAPPSGGYVLLQKPFLLDSKHWTQFAWVQSKRVYWKKSVTQIKKKDSFFLDFDLLSIAQFNKLFNSVRSDQSRTLLIPWRGILANLLRLYRCTARTRH